MLKYLIAVTSALVLTALALGLLYGYLARKHGRNGRAAVTVGTAAGFVGAVVMAILKNATSLIHTGVWNLRIFAVSLAALLVFAVFSLTPLKRRSWSAKVVLGSAAVLAFTFLFYALPDVLAYPFSFTLNGVSVLSTDFLYRLIGWLLGLVLMLLTFYAVERLLRRVGERAAGVLLGVVLGINALLQISKMLQVMVTRRMITAHWVFVIVQHSANYSDWFIYAALLVALVLPLLLLVRVARANEPYENPAQHRKLRAGVRSTRRWCAVGLICFALAVSNLTWVNAIDSREVELSPVEDCELIGDELYVPLEQVSDGHLHRFAYTTPSGIAVRFIVIQKPNGTSYGVGLDACDICGETGYYERNGQIVCNLCDVVMNVNTIGFKGGCNPIVIDYSIQNGYIIVPTYTLIENEGEFKR